MTSPKKNVAALLIAFSATFASLAGVSAASGGLVAGDVGGLLGGGGGAPVAAHVGGLLGGGGGSAGQ